MTEKNKEHPKGSEIDVQKWLRQIGAENICFTGGSSNGPPDFIIEFEGEEAAIEVTLLDYENGWSQTTEQAVFREARKLYEEAYKEGFAWHGYIEYDPRESKNSMKDRSWKKRMRKALRSTCAGEFQLLSPKIKRGEGVILNLHPASNKGGISQVCINCGSELLPILLERIVKTLETKTEKIRKSESFSEYKWWLVLHDHIVLATRGILTDSEAQEIEGRVRDCLSRKCWSKIVLVSRFHTAIPPTQLSNSFWPLWEDGGHPDLPKSSDQ